MVVSRVDREIVRRLVLPVGSCVGALMVLSGCGGADLLQSLGTSKPTLNVTEKPEAPPREVSPSEAKAARARLGEAAVLAAARANPRDVEAALAGAGLLRRQGDRAGALALLDSAAAVAPNDARLLRDRGLLALELGNVSLARGHLRKAVASGSGDWQTHSALGTALAAGGDQKGAQRHFAEALKQAPGNPVVLNNLALSMALEGRRGEAEQMLREAAAGQKKGGDVRVAQNLALVSKIGDGKGKTAGSQSKPAPAKQSAVPMAPKENQRSAAAPATTRTAQVD